MNGKWLAASAFALAACGGAVPPGYLGEVHGVQVTVNVRAEIPSDEEGLLQETGQALVVAERVWGELPLLWEVQHDGGWFPCETSEGAVWTYGCTYPRQGLTRAAPDVHGCRAGVVIHEMGHALGINDHGDPRYAKAAEAIEAFCGR